MREEFDYQLSKIDDTALHLLDIIRSTSSAVVIFRAAMGAGKTTLIAEMCKQLNVEDIPTSPTFAIVNVYKTSDNKIINHFDFYRVEKLEEVYDIGFEEYISSGELCFIEWPDIVSDLLPDSFMEVTIQVTGENSRHIIVENKSDE